MPPQRLVAFHQHILQTDPLAQQVTYNNTQWANRIVDCAMLVDITQMYPINLTRANILEIGGAAVADHAQIKKLFLATMIWGYGETGYGPYRTNIMLNDPTTPNVLESVFQAISEGRILDAYEGFQIRQCGPSFFTKFIYFVGRLYNIHPLPLIFDSRVATAFQVLSDDLGLIFTQFARATMVNGRLLPRRFSQGYLNYVNTVNQWAEELGCRADAIEMFLFDPQPEFWNWHGA